MTKIKLHGDLADQLGRSEWDLCVDSPNEALWAINSKTNQKLNKILIDKSKSNQKIAILIDGKELMLDGSLKGEEDSLREDFQVFSNSDYFLNRKNIKTIDFVPIIEGASEDVMTAIGIVLIVISLAWNPTGETAMMINKMMFASGVALTAAGITAMMMEPPEFSEAKKIEGVTAGSYLFNGPVNIVREGNPVPLVYGQILAGSNVISAFNDVGHVNAADGHITS